MLYSFFKPLLFSLPPETAHNLTLKAMKTPVFPTYPHKERKSLKLSLWNKKFPNPLGLAAGFDKNAEVISATLGLGFGYTEVGTVTCRPQQGNPRPRIFRSPKHHAVINAMGFPNEGYKVFQDNLTSYLEQKPRPSGLVGVNIGMNKDTQNPTQDYISLLRKLSPIADYLTINISSPNTPGLRDFQKPENFSRLIGSLLEERERISSGYPPPLLIKLAPDLDVEEQTELAALCLETGVDGLILTNTSFDRPSFLPEGFSNRKGGLSGKPIFERSNRVLRNFYKLTQGKLPLIGVGGIETADDAYLKIRSGASLVQLYTGMIYRGPGIANDIMSGLEDLLSRDGFETVQQAVGVDVS